VAVGVLSLDLKYKTDKYCLGGHAAAGCSACGVDATRLAVVGAAALAFAVRWPGSYTVVGRSKLDSAWRRVVTILE